VNRFVALALALVVLPLSGCAVSSGQNPRPASASLIDLNLATAAQLQQLPGITAAYARRIIANRPYKVKHELETRKILPPSLYARIRDRVTAVERPGADFVSRLQIPQACKSGV
jgi:DNA uptake protein ComE-like DNA-binding protein